MVTQEKWDALRIAAWFEGGLGGCEMEAAEELRRLHEVNQEMLEVLKEVYTTCDWHGDDGQEAMMKAREVIAKATGEQT